jgi:Zn-dependent protease
MLGRVSANPIKHIDLVGTIVVPIITLIMSGGGVLFGWAKPVPVNFENLRDPKRDMLWVAAAGPGANIAMALLWAILAKLLPEVDAGGSAAEFKNAVVGAGILWNVSLAILNLFPLLPLDGGRILVSVLPNRMAYTYSRLEPYGMIILLALIVTPILGWILRPVMNGTLSGICSLFGLDCNSLFGP